MEKRVGIVVEASVDVRANVDKARAEIASLVGNNAPVPAGAPAVIGGPAPVGGPTPGGPHPVSDQQRKWMEDTAWRMQQGVASGASSARTEADYRRMMDKLSRADYYAQGAGNKDLIDSLTKLRESLDAQRKAQEAAKSGGAPGAPPPIPPAGGGPAGGPAGGGSGGFGGLGGWLQGQGGNLVRGGLTGMLGGSAGTAAFGLLSRFLGGPLGIGLGVAGAANLAFNAISNNLTETNAPARNEISGMADLARQYGTTGNLMGGFRDGDGWTNERFRRLGYSASSAAHVAALYDRPGGMMGDTESILKFSRTMGMDETKVAGAARTLGLAGVGGSLKGGDAEDGLRILKLAMKEGIQQGIAGSDTMNSLLGFAQKNSAMGMTTNSTALAYAAEVQRRLNDPRNTNMQLRGQAGMDVMTGFMQGMGNTGDLGTQYVLAQALLKKGLPSARAAGMVAQNGNLTDEGLAYGALQHESPLEAAKYLMSRAASGQNPETMKLMANTVDSVAGGSVYLKKLYYKSLNPNASDQQIMSMIGGGGLSEYLDNNGQALARNKAGAGLASDVQGGNEIASRNLYLRVANEDRDMIKSLIGLKLTGGTEEFMSQIKDLFKATQANIVSDLFGKLTGSGGSMAGTAGQFYQGKPQGLFTGSQLPSADTVSHVNSVTSRVKGETSAQTMLANATYLAEGGSNARVAYGLTGDFDAGNYKGGAKDEASARQFLIQKMGRWEKQYQQQTGQTPMGSGGQYTAEYMRWYAERYSPAASNPHWLPNVSGFMQASGWNPGGTGSLGPTSGAPAVPNNTPDDDMTPAGRAAAARAAQQGNLAGLNPTFAKQFGGLLAMWAKANPSGLIPTVLEGRRSSARQAQLYAQGRTAPGDVVTNAQPGQTPHEYGLAADVIWVDPRTGKRISQNDPRSMAAYKALGGMASGAGLMWGGNFPGFKDFPHFEAAGFDGIKAQHGTLPKGYAGGGYTGDGPRSGVAGVVHHGEFVMDAATTARYRPVLEGMRSGAGGGVTVDVGGNVMVNVQLSPQARQALQGETARYRQAAGQIVGSDLQSWRGAR